MRLVADIGNSNIKIALWKNKLLQKVLQFETSTYKKMNFHLHKYKNNSIESVFFSCVAKEEIANHFKKYAKKLFKCSIKRIRSTKKLFNIKNNYQASFKLGDDRWCSIVGSHIKHKKLLMLVDSGTATTVDIVDKQGRYLGGYIFAGFDGYKNSFNQIEGLKKLNIQLNQKKKIKFFPTNTKDGISDGYKLMISSAIETIFNETRIKFKTKPIVIISGGFGADLSRLAKIKNNYQQNIVLESLGFISDFLR